MVCGNRQKPGLDFDFDERYTPVATKQAPKLFLSLTAIKNWPVVQFDVVTAYLNATIDRRVIYMRQPTGYKEIGPNSEDLACLV